MLKVVEIVPPLPTTFFTTQTDSREPLSCLLRLPLMLIYSRPGNLDSRLSTPTDACNHTDASARPGQRTVSNYFYLFFQGSTLPAFLNSSAAVPSRVPTRP
jgi:hypothetical protein